MVYKDLQKTLIIIKPDAYKRGKIGEIISRFENKGLQLIAMKSMLPPTALIAEHYSHLPEKILPKVKAYMNDTVVVMIWRGIGAIEAGRQLIGATDPLKSSIGSIRGDFGMSIGRNLVHGSDSVESANKEIQLWYPEFIEPEVIEDHDVYEY